MELILKQESDKKDDQEPAGIDADGNALTYAVVSQPSNGTLSGTAPNLTYTPNSYVNGNDTFAFIVSDSNVISDEKTVSIQIDAANNPPTANKQV